jgi:hypothetical protein
MSELYGPNYYKYVHALDKKIHIFGESHLNLSQYLAKKMNLDRTDKSGIFQYLFAGREMSESLQDKLQKNKKF